LKDYIEILAVQTQEIATLRGKAREAALQDSEEEEDEEDEEDEFEDEIDLQDLDEGQSADQSAKAKFTNRIKAEIAMIREQYALQDEDEDEDDSDYEEDDDEDCERVSPLDAFSEFSAIKETLTGMDSGLLLSWFSKTDLVDWNTLLDANILADQQDKLKSAA
jgi:hypothetical protein